ncbi:trichothecene efflux pump [Metarhizium album ARSEF 1941]|uniref:Trichothecene efflux pump n=1 Tax=Metarhizium album (strain ARSEF 1941) TaxID=1081103 RepID=A0A0B2X2J5_METAS|nr:trichothecene efflux pump [Metarhizium album ARSEF 1941]KHO00504.1 trichothecene efflux pump [Metarhizium album ARSEF 1941]
MGQVNDTIITQGMVGREVLNSQIYDDHGDPYHAALEDASGNTTISFQTWAAVFFLGLSLTSGINFPLSIFVAASSTVAKEMQGNVNNLNWIAGGWYLSGSIAFAMGGQLSDYFGRKGVVLAGQALLLVGHLVGALAQTFNQLIAAMVIIGAGTGLVFVVVTNSNMIVGDISGAVALVGTVFAYHPPRQVYIDRTKKDILLELDYVGLLMYTASISLLFLNLG